LENSAILRFLVVGFDVFFWEEAFQSFNHERKITATSTFMCWSCAKNFLVSVSWYIQQPGGALSCNPLEQSILVAPLVVQRAFSPWLGAVPGFRVLSSLFIVLWVCSFVCLLFSRVRSPNTINKTSG
jgi:hypothetical protein